MKAFVIATALSVMAIAPAAAQQSCVQNGAFVPCGSQQMGMQGGMMNGGMSNGMAMQSGQPGMSDQRMGKRRMTRAEMRRMKRMQKMQGGGEDQM